MLSFSKCINYAQLENTGASTRLLIPETRRSRRLRTPGNCSFVVFIASWTYLRHYQNIRMLYNVWHQKWMPNWFRCVRLMRPSCSF